MQTNEAPLSHVSLLALKESLLSERIRHSDVKTFDGWRDCNPTDRTFKVRCCPNFVFISLCSHVLERKWRSKPMMLHGGRPREFKFATLNLDADAHAGQYLAVWRGEDASRLTSHVRHKLAVRRVP
ncbi:hypothetical protein AB1N83_006123 [Pleurotus pulmonarius]